MLIDLCIYSFVSISHFRLTVRVVSSRRSGMGKSLHVKSLPGEMHKKISYHIIPVHGPRVDFSTVIKLLHPYTPSYESPSYQIIHIDIDSEVIFLNHPSLYIFADGSK